MLLYLPLDGMVAIERFDVVVDVVAAGRRLATCAHEIFAWVRCRTFFSKFLVVEFRRGIMNVLTMRSRR